MKSIKKISITVITSLVSIGCTTGINETFASANEIDTNSLIVNSISQSMASFSASIQPGPYAIVNGKNVPKN